MIPSESPSFDARAALAELTNGQSESPGRKLSFSEQCAVLAAVRNHVKPALISAAFGVSRITVSQIGGATSKPIPSWQDPDRHRPPYKLEDPPKPRTRDPNRAPRYRAVAREFELLGEDAFIRRYYTEDIHTRLTRVRNDIENERAQRVRIGPNPHAHQYAFANIGAFEVYDNDFWRVSWTPDPRQPGWIFAQCQPDGAPIPPEAKHNWKGREALGGPAKPFQTSKQAWTAAWRYCGQTPPRKY